MKGMRGKLLKKLQSVRPIGYLRQDHRVLQVSASDGYVVDSWSNSSVLQEHTQMSWKEQEQSKLNKMHNCVEVQEPDVIDVSELMRDREDEEMALQDDKENVGPRPPLGKPKECSVTSERSYQETEDEQSGNEEADHIIPLSEIDISSFRRPDLNSRSLFDPKLLAAFRQAVREHIRMIEAERRARSEEQSIKEDGTEQEPPMKARRIDQENQNQNEVQDLDPLLGFESKCPPGGDGAVIFYTTTLRGIRKTFEDCNSVRFLLQTFRVLFIERDISMHMEFKEELRRVLDSEAVVPPKLFVKGRYIGGAEEVLTLHEQGKLRPIFEGVPIDRSAGPCEGCAGERFVLCFRCSGSRRTVTDDGLWRTCLECNENGLLICPICC